MILVPGRVAPWNGQMIMVDAAGPIVSGSDRSIAFVFAGEDLSHPRYARSVHRQARAHGIDTLCRFVGHCADMPAALAAADVVAAPSLEPPFTGRAPADAQARGLPLVATTIGMLTGEPAVPATYALRIAHRLPRAAGQRLHARARSRRGAGARRHPYEALEARGRQFAEFMFSLQSVAEATREVYTPLFARDT
jgi:glycosyltransferase involved in cell wall biosynthesis